MNGEFIYQETHTGDEEETPAEREETEGCPECENSRIVADDVHGELICDECGFVVKDDQIDTGPEWSAFNQREVDQKSRVGAPLTSTMHDKGLTTKIHWQDTDAYGKTLSSRKRSKLKRMRTWQERIRTKDAGERNLQLALAEIHRMSSALGIPRPVREVASIIYRRALKENLIRGRSIEGVATSALYAACRKENIPRSLDELAEVSRVPRIEIGRTYRYLADQLDLEMRPVDPKRYVPRFCSELDLEESVKQRAKEILDDAATEGLLSGKSPTGLAGAAIYTAALLCNDKRTQSEIAEVAQVTEVTIRNRYQEQLSVVDAYDT
ncbi:transcription initiation factor IIB [Halobacteriales archaeon Cl-PHB]